jgi:hypothetical protein
VFISYSCTARVMLRVPSFSTDTKNCLCGNENQTEHVKCIVVHGTCVVPITIYVTYNIISHNLIGDLLQLSTQVDWRQLTLLDGKDRSIIGGG